MRKEAGKGARVRGRCGKEQDEPFSTETRFSEIRGGEGWKYSDETPGFALPCPCPCAHHHSTNTDRRYASLKMTLAWSRPSSASVFFASERFSAFGGKPAVMEKVAAASSPEASAKRATYYSRLE